MEQNPSMERRLEISEQTSLESIHQLIDKFENVESFGLVTIDVSIAAYGAVSNAIARLRSCGLPALVKIHREDWVCETDELTYVIRELRDFDQLTLSNLLELLSEHIPKEAIIVLMNESRIELKSFQEWIVASHDPRIHKYPNLPWRSFIRKVNAENFEFASSILDLFFMYGSDAPNSPELKKLVSQFLESKKKVLCLFPKKWGKDQ